MVFVIGPGHGAPAALASLWLEGSIAKFYPGTYDRNLSGLVNLIDRFSVPGGHPRYVFYSHNQWDHLLVLYFTLTA